eukprot:9143239-Karenia_brevis.AAC.1
MSPSGQEVYAKDEIAEAFATFYEQLYTSKRVNSHSSDNIVSAGSISFQNEELRTALRKMKNGKAKDTAGVVAEMLKYGGE